jgi:ribosome-associated toxin RatA of RatAB toxin-antitoxin module
MRDVTRSALVARPPAMLYRVVEEVERYPEFVPGCTLAQVLERDGNTVVARLAVSRGLLSTAFTTRNTMDPGRSVHMLLVEGPFRVLEGHEIRVVRPAVRRHRRDTAARVRGARAEPAGGVSAAAADDGEGW